MGVSPDTAPKPRQSAALRIPLGYADVDSFVERYARNVSRSGLFLPAETPLPVGTLLRFEVVLRDGQPVLRGEGEVTWTTAGVAGSSGADDGEALSGMAVRLQRLDERSRSLVERVLAFKEREGNLQRFFTAAPDPFTAPAAPTAAGAPRAAALDVDQLPRARALAADLARGAATPEEAELLALLKRPDAPAAEPLSAQEASRQLDALLRSR